MDDVAYDYRPHSCCVDHFVAYDVADHSFAFVPYDLPVAYCVVPMVNNALADQADLVLIVDGATVPMFVSVVDFDLVAAVDFDLVDLMVPAIVD